MHDVTAPFRMGTILHGGVAHGESQPHHSISGCEDLEECALGVPAVTLLMTFGLTNRYTRLEEDYPGGDGVPRRPLPFDEELRPKPAYDAIHTAFEEAISREPVWMPL